ncbi:sensor histidine kinase [Streptomyces bacillaris]
MPPLAADLLVVAVVGLFTGSDLAVNDPGSRQADALSWALFALSLAALVVRRRRPVPVACVTGAACAGWALYGHIGEPLNLPVIVALYTVAVLGDRCRTLWAGVTAAVVSGAVALIVGRDVVNPQGLPVLEMIRPLVPLLLGEAVRTRRELLAEYAARAERAEAEREREAARRVRQERVRVAREIHDILAHTVSAMTVQAGVALDALDTAPEVSRRAMTQVRASGKEAVRVTLRREPSGGAYPGVVETTAYRIVQEALTNVVKHSGAGRVAVSLTGADAHLEIEIVDDGPPRPEPSTGEGYGLIGMRERVPAVGGTLTYGPVPGGGFRGHAVLPTEGAPS